MPSLASLRERFEYINTLYEENRALIAEVQDEATTSLVPQLAVELQLQKSGVDRALAFLEDPVTIFRFLRKAHLDPLLASELLRKTLRWRLTSSLDLISPSSIEPLYTENPLIYLHPEIRDKFGRHAAVLNLRCVVRPEDGTLDGLKEFIAFKLEVARRYLADLSKRDDGSRPHVQIVFLLDLAGANLSNLEIELLPFTVDLLKNHFPGTVGAIFVLNYAWAYAGMWQVAKRVLPQVALERIFFPTKTEILEYFDKDHLLVDHGGTIAYKYRLSSNHLLTKYGRPSYYLRHRSISPLQSAAASPSVSRHLSRVPSLESLHETYYSVPATPRSTSRSPRSASFSLPGSGSKAPGMHRLPTWLDMTMSSAPSYHVRHTSDMGSTAELEPSLSRVASSRDFREAVHAAADAEASLESFYDDNDADTESDAARADEQWDLESLDSNSDLDRLPKGTSSARVEPRLVGSPSLQSVSNQREDSLARLRNQLERLPSSSGQRRGRSSGTVSPYNVNNPFYGYPATRYVASSETPGSLKLPNPRPYHSRRRKRDLLRTLSYLAALRILALHRKIKWRLALFWRILWNKLFRWGAISSQSMSRRASAEDSDLHESDTPSRRTKKGVRWAADDSAAATLREKLRVLAPLPLLRRVPRWMLWVAVLVFLRSRYFRRKSNKALTLVQAKLEYYYQMYLIKQI